MKPPRTALILSSSPKKHAVQVISPLHLWFTCAQVGTLEFSPSPSTSLPYVSPLPASHFHQASYCCLCVDTVRIKLIAFSSKEFLFHFPILNKAHQPFLQSLEHHQEALSQRYLLAGTSPSYFNGDSSHTCPGWGESWAASHQSPT